MNKLNTYDEKEACLFIPVTDQTQEEGFYDTVTDPTTYTMRDSLTNEAGHEAQNLAVKRSVIERH